MRLSGISRPNHAKPRNDPVDFIYLLFERPSSYNVFHLMMLPIFQNQCVLNLVQHEQHQQSIWGKDFRCPIESSARFSSIIVKDDSSSKNAYVYLQIISLRNNTENDLWFRIIMGIYSRNWSCNWLKRSLRGLFLFAVASSSLWSKGWKSNL